MTPAQRDYRARCFAEVNRRARRRPAPLAGLSSIVWGTRGLRGLGVATPIPNPDTQPGAWPGLSPGGFTFTPSPFISGGCIIGPDGKSVCTQLQPLDPPTPATTNQGGTGTVVVTPTSGPIPSPGTVAAGTAAPASWLDQSLIGGIPNKFLVLGGIGALFVFGGKK